MQAKELTQDEIQAIKDAVLNNHNQQLLIEPIAEERVRELLAIRRAKMSQLITNK